MTLTDLNVTFPHHRSTQVSYPVERAVVFAGTQPVHRLPASVSCCGAQGSALVVMGTRAAAAAAAATSHGDPANALLVVPFLKVRRRRRTHPGLQRRSGAVLALSCCLGWSDAAQNRGT